MGVESLIFSNIALRVIREKPEVLVVRGAVSGSRMATKPREGIPC
jgi:hypothetical protein